VKKQRVKLNNKKAMIPKMMQMMTKSS